MSVMGFKKGKGVGMPKAYVTIHASTTVSYAAGGYAVDLSPNLVAISAVILSPVANLSGWIPGVGTISGAAFKLKLLRGGASGSPLSEAADTTNVSGTQNVVVAFGV